jgi:hypothetical protein
MFKKIDFKGLNYKELDKLDSHDLKRDNLHSFYQTFDFINLVKSWPDIIGSTLAKVTSPLKIKGDTLIILSKHSSYSQNISFLSEEIKQKIFVLFPELKPIIRKINFLTQESYFNQAFPVEEMRKEEIRRFHPQDPKYKLLKAEAEKLFQGIPDEELKELMISLYLQSSSP